jgi:hypothetical protein
MGLWSYVIKHRVMAGQAFAAANASTTAREVRRDGSLGKNACLTCIAFPFLVRNTETAGPSCKKTSPSVRNSRAIGLSFAAASALLARRRGDLQRAGENSRCWEILRADAWRHLPDDRTDWWCNSRTRVCKMIPKGKRRVWLSLNPL